jgi:hypothetical protein
MEKKEYNGWYNYETWLLALWIDNEESSYNYWREIAQESYDVAEADKMFTRDERATSSLADRLKDAFEEAQPEVTGFWADLINAAMSEINWYDVAEHYISDVEKEKPDADQADESA